MTRNSTCLLSPVAMRTLPSLVSTRTCARPGMEYTFENSSAEARGVSPAIVNSAAKPVASFTAISGWRASFMAESSVRCASKTRYDNWRGNVPRGVSPCSLRKGPERHRRKTPHRWCGDRGTAKELTLGGGLFRASGAGFGPQGGEKLVDRQGINDISLLEPATPRHGHAVADERQMQGVVGVGRDDHLDPAFLAHAQIDVGEIKTVGVRVAFHGHAVFCRGVQNLGHVVIESLAAQQQAPGRMADDLRVGILDGAKHAVGHG